MTLCMILVYWFPLIKEMVEYFAGISASCSITTVNYDVNCCCGYIPGKLHAVSISLIHSTITSFDHHFMFTYCYISAMQLPFHSPSLLL